MATVSEETVKHNLQEICFATSKAVDYAKGYAKVGMRMTDHELVVQCMYVLNNITHWRGEQATRIRENLQEFTKCAR